MGSRRWNRLLLLQVWQVIVGKKMVPREIWGTWVLVDTLHRGIHIIEIMISNNNNVNRTLVGVHIIAAARSEQQAITRVLGHRSTIHHMERIRTPTTTSRSPSPRPPSTSSSSSSRFRTHATQLPIAVPCREATTLQATHLPCRLIIIIHRRLAQTTTATTIFTPPRGCNHHRVTTIRPRITLRTMRPTPRCRLHI